MKNINNINFDKYEFISFKLEKIEDTAFDGDHPNGYNPGFKINNATIMLDKSNQYCALFVHDGPDRWFHTSEVKCIEECDKHDLLHTKNSVYKITPNFEPAEQWENQFPFSVQDMIDDINNGPKE